MLRWVCVAAIAFFLMGFAAQRAACVTNETQRSATLTYFEPGEPVPKGGYARTRIRAGKVDCVNLPRRNVSVFVRASVLGTPNSNRYRQQIVSCSPIAIDAATTFTLHGNTLSDVECTRVSPP